MSLDVFRVGLAGAPSHQLEARQSTPVGCTLANGDLYQFPNATSTIDGTVPLTFRWNTRCPGISSRIDLYLYEPSSTGQIKAWTGIDYALGEYTVQLMPRWWNSTTTALLQVNIVNSGGMSWATTGPPGPVWTVNYPESAMLTTTTDQGVVKTLTNSAAATNGGDAIFQSVNNTKSGGISKGAIAAAVIVPIIVIAAAVAVAMRFWRQREAEKRRRWSAALSSASNLDWEKGAREGERTGSMLGRPSMSSYGGPGGAGRASRASMAASSVWAMENNMAGAGAGAGAGATRPGGPMRSVSNDAASISRSSVVLPNGNVRQSRISFAESTKPSADRRSRMSLGNDLRPHSAVFNLRAGSRSATDLPVGTGTGTASAASSAPSTPAQAQRRAYATGSAIADDDEHEAGLGQDDAGVGVGAGAAVMGVGYGGKHKAGRSMLGMGAPVSAHSGVGANVSGGGSGAGAASPTATATATASRMANEAGGSVDELRELEESMLARRSVYSHYSTAPSGVGSGQYSNPPTPRLDTDNTEDLDLPPPTSASRPALMTSSSSTSTVAYGPDQMLAVYAARAKGAGAGAGVVTDSNEPSDATSFSTNVPPLPTKSSMGKKGGIKILTSFGKKHENSGNASGVSPAGGSPTTSMPQGQGQGHVPLQVPGVAMTRQNSGNVGRGGDAGYEVGQAQ